MNSWLSNSEEQAREAVAGWPEKNVEVEVARGEKLYASMVELLRTKEVGRADPSSYNKIKFYISTGDPIDLEQARLLLEKNALLFVKRGSVLVPSGESIGSVENYIFRSDGMYIKAVKDDGNPTTLREGFIGIMCLNPLQSPNFARILGTWRHQRPIGYKNPEGKYAVVYTTNKKLISDYVSYEEVKGVTLSDYLVAHRGQGLKNIVWQICNALRLAYKACKFYHADLHISNVLVTSDPQTYTYYEQGHAKTFTTNITVVMIDYGRSAATYNEVEYSKWWELDEDNRVYETEQGEVVYPIRDLLFLFNGMLSIKKDIDASVVELVEDLIAMCSKSRTMTDLEAIMKKVAPNNEEVISPTVNFCCKLSVEDNVIPTSVYRKHMEVLSDKIYSKKEYEDEDVLAYACSLLGLLTSSEYKLGMIRDVKGTINNCLVLLSEISYKRQNVYDLYVNLSDYL